VISLLPVLQEAAAELGAERALEWSDVVMVGNVAGIPAARREAGDFLWNRGFNLAVLGKDGSPAQYCKCRPAGDVIAQTETTILKRLSASLDGRIVPRTIGLETSDLQIQVAEHICGQRHDVLLRSLTVNQSGESLEAVIRASEEVGKRAELVLSDVLELRTSIDLLEESARHLGHLTPAGIATAERQALERILAAAGPVRGSLQHGDLWPKNVVRDHRGWWLLDFEMFGRVQTPLYDACHLVRTTTALRSPSSRQSLTWMERMDSAETDTRFRRILRDAAARHDLDSAQAAACLVYYAIDMAARSYVGGCSNGSTVAPLRSF
jgi:hypothetical protein